MNALATLPKYESYKNSGHENFGDIPAGWAVLKMKHLIDTKAGFAFPSDSFTDEGIPVIRIGDLLASGNVSLDNSPKLPDKFTKYLKEYSVFYGDILMAMTGGTIGKVSEYLSNEEALLNQRVCKFLPKSGIVRELALHWMKSGYWRDYIDLTAFGGAQPNISDNEIKEMYICLPETFEEQKAISDFLDKKTTQIDDAIAIKEKQIALLKERKQIIIQKAVTQGLNTDVQMRNSGVDWIGQIPSHWEVKRLKYVTKIVKRIIGHEGPSVLSITQQGIKIKDIESGEGQLAMDYSKYQIVEAGNFAMNHMDLLTGYVDISKYDGVISPDYRVFINTYDELDDEYLLSIFQLGYQQKIFYRYGQGVSLLGRWRFPADNFNNFFIPIPPKEEQDSIVNYVRTEWGKVDKAIALLVSQIEKLKEYKSTLVNSAVTGKIKVA